MKKKDFAIILLACGLAILIRSFIFNISIVRQSSMYPTLQSGNLLFVSKLGVRQNIKKGSIVILKSPAEDKLLIKRVLALPGQVVDIEDGKVIVNGEAQQEPYTSEPETSPVGETSHWELSDDQVFVLGDNRPNSIDSRILGPIKMKDVKGIVKFRIYPFEKLVNYEK